MFYPTILLKLVGMCYIDFEYYLPSQLHFISIALNWFLYIFFSLCHVHLAYFFFLESIQGNNDLARVSQVLTMVVINTFAFFTLLFYKLKYKEYLKLVDYMNENFLTRSAYGLTFMTGERCYVVSVRHLFWWTLMCVGGTLQWCVVPLFTRTRMLPIDVKYPFNALVSDFIDFFVLSFCFFLGVCVFGEEKFSNYFSPIG